MYTKNNEVGITYRGDKAIDGIYETPDYPWDAEQSSLVHTNIETSPWIQADLVKEYCIRAVKIWNRNHDPLPDLSMTYCSQLKEIP